IQKPDLASRYAWLFETYNSTLDLSTPGKVVVQENPADGQAGPAKRVVVDKEIVPLELESLRAGSGSSYGQGQWHWQRAMTLLKHFAEPATAPALVHWYKKAWRDNEMIPETLVRIGAPALPWLREAIRARSYWASPGAAKTLAQIGDPGEGRRLLLD